MAYQPSHQQRSQGQGYPKGSGQYAPGSGAQGPAYGGRSPYDVTGQEPPTQRQRTPAQHAAPAGAGRATAQPYAYAAQGGAVQANPVTSRRGGAGGRRGGRARVGVTVLVGVVCLLVGALLGLLLLSRVVRLPQSTLPMTLTESQLDDVVGTYTYDGTVYTITAREAIEDSVSVDSRKNDDGTYDAPTADMVLSYARDSILAAQVAAEGITVTDDELNQYMQDFASTTDLATIAEQYSMTQDQARRMLIEAEGVKELRDSVVGTVPTKPAEPQAPSDGDTETTNSTYAQYIISLLGSNWDSTNNTWANTDNAYYEALKDASFSATSANYEAAEAAYSVAASQYSSQLSSANEQWNDYVNSLMSKGSITIDTLQS